MTSSRWPSDYRIYPISFLKLIFTLFYSLSLFAEDSKIAIFIQGTDLKRSDNNAADKGFISEANYATDVYRKAGFKIVEISPQTKPQISTKSIQDTITRHANSSEMHVLFFAHGQADQALMSGSSPEVLRNTPHEFYLAPAGGYSIQGTDIRKALLDAKTKNPNLKIYLPIGSCYGGTLAEQVSDIPGLLALPATGADRLGYIWEHDERFYSELNNKRSFNASQESTWTEQLKMSSRGVYAIHQLRYEPEMTTLPLLQTGLELFLEDYCARKKNEPWAIKLGCNSYDSGTSKMIPEALKQKEIGYFQSTVHEQMKQLESLRDRLGCGESSTDSGLNSFRIFRTQIARQALVKLRDEIESLPVEKFNEILQERSDLVTELFYHDGELNALKAKSSADLKSSLDQWKSFKLERLRAFKVNCLEPNGYSSNKSFQDGRYGQVDCDTFIGRNFGTEDEYYLPEPIKKPSKKDAGYYAVGLKIFENFPDGSNEELTRSEYNKYLNRVESYFDDKSKNKPIEALVTIGAVDVPPYENFCKLINGNIEEAKNNIACSNLFNGTALVNDWSRFVDIVQLGERGLFSRVSK